MVIVSGFEVIGISVHYRVYIKYFLTKTKLSTCSDMLLNPNAFRCDILFPALLIENTLGIAYQNFG